MNLSVRQRARLFLSTPEEFQVWYAGQDPKWLMYHADSLDFKRFIFWTYTWKKDLMRYWFKTKAILMQLF